MECDYCGEAGHHWSTHPEARADVVDWERQIEAEVSPFGDHKG